jgi:hypothetical protein
MTTKTTYTDEQAVQMANDTTITEFDGGKGRAVVKAAPVGESDPRFYMDREWLAWMADWQPRWTVVQMNDSHDFDVAWVVTLRR